MWRGADLVLASLVQKKKKAAVPEQVRKTNNAQTKKAELVSPPPKYPSHTMCAWAVGPAQLGRHLGRAHSPGRRVDWHAACAVVCVKVQTLNIAPCTCRTPPRLWCRRRRGRRRTSSRAASRKRTSQQQKTPGSARGSRLLKKRLLYHSWCAYPIYLLSDCREMAREWQWRL